VIRVGNLQCPNDARECRQHGVDGERLRRHGRRGEQHELNKPNGMGAAILSHYGV
jgi:hypothetical protein